MAPFTRGELLFGDPLTGVEIARRHRAGAEIIMRTADRGVPEGPAPLFVVHPRGQLDAVTADTKPEATGRDILVLLDPVPPRLAGEPPARAPATADEAAAGP